jgi:hypothetical protein
MSMRSGYFCSAIEGRRLEQEAVDLGPLGPLEPELLGRVHGQAGQQLPVDVGQPGRLPGLQVVRPDVVRPVDGLPQEIELLPVGREGQGAHGVAFEDLVDLLRRYRQPENGRPAFLLGAEDER